jgi:hypothetical protein
MRARANLKARLGVRARAKSATLGPNMRPRARSDSPRSIHFVARSGVRARRFALALAALGLTATAALTATACGGDKLDPAQCRTIRGKAFGILNGTPMCSTDKDCMVSSWPCGRASNQKITDEIKPIKDEWDKGKCEPEKNQICAAAPAEVVCVQSVCQEKIKPVPVVE